MHSLLTINSLDFKRFGQTQSVKLFSQMLWAEASRLRLPITKIHISENVLVPDEGIDAEVDEQPFKDLLHLFQQLCHLLTFVKLPQLDQV
jgi:hypothetical protein